VPSSDHALEIPDSDPSGLDETHIIMEEVKENPLHQLGSMSSPLMSPMKSESSSYIIVPIEDSLPLNDKAPDRDVLDKTMDSTFIDSSARFANVESSPAKPSLNEALAESRSDGIIPKEHISLECSKTDSPGNETKSIEQDLVATRSSEVPVDLEHNPSSRIIQSKDSSKNAKIRVVAENTFEFDTDSDSDLPTFEQLISSTQKIPDDKAIEEQIKQKNKIKEELEDDPDALREALNSFHESFDGSADGKNELPSSTKAQNGGTGAKSENLKRPEKLPKPKIVRKSEPASGSARSVVKQRSGSLNLSKRRKAPELDDFDSIPSTMPERRSVSDSSRWQSVRTESSATALIDLTEMSDDSSKESEAKVIAQPSFQSNESDSPPPSSAPAAIGGFPSGHVPQFRKQTFKRKIQRRVSEDPAAPQWRVINPSSNK